MLDKKQYYKIEIICEWDNEDKLTLGSLMASEKPPKSIDITHIDINAYANTSYVDAHTDTQYTYMTHSPIHGGHISIDKHTQW